MAHKGETGRQKPFEVAVIGAGIQFPGGLETPEALWTFMAEGREASRPVPENRWSSARFYSPDPQAAGKTLMQRGNFLRRPIEAFDAALFGLSPREAALMDPLQRLALETAHRAAEDAGLPPNRLRGSRCGVYMGAFMLDFYCYTTRPALRLKTSDHFGASAVSATMVAARLSHALDLRGPAVSMDTACSSSMTAVHAACRALENGDCDMAFAGGANAIFIPEISIVMSKGGFLASDGRSRSFAENAEGYGRGEGAGMTLLRPLKDALRAGNPIRAVISAVGMNHDGRTPGVAVPSQRAQEALMASVMARAGADPARLGAVEAHGTGTALGDPIEARAIASVAGRLRPAHRPPLPIGSVKSHIGHLEAAAGVAGLVRAALMIQAGEMPPWNQETPPSSRIDWEKFRLTLPRKPVKLAKNAYVLVNSFGYGGTNAAAVLRGLTRREKALRARAAARRLAAEIPPEPAGLSSPEAPPPVPGYAEGLLLSAHSAEGLRELGAKWAECIRRQFAGRPDMEKSAGFWRFLCKRNLLERQLHPCRVLVAPADGTALGALAALDALARGEKNAALVSGGHSVPGKAGPEPLGAEKGEDFPEDLPHFPLPLYPQGLEKIVWPESVAAVADRRNCAVHPVLGTPIPGPQPVWRADLTPGFMPWLPDHVLRRGRERAWLFPAAAYVEAGLAARREIAGAGSAAILEDLRLNAPLLPPLSRTGLMSHEFDPKTRLLSFFAQSVAGGEDWQACGSVRLPDSRTWQGENAAPRTEAETLGWEAVDAKALRARFSAQGLEYGPAFQGLYAISRSGTGTGAKGTGRLHPPEAESLAVSDRPGFGERTSILPPGLTDAAWQLLAALVPESPSVSYMPASVGRFVLNQEALAENPKWEGLRAEAVLKALDGRRLAGDVRIFDARGRWVAETLDLECLAAPFARGRGALLALDFEKLPALPLLAEFRRLAFIGRLPEAGRAAARILEEEGGRIAYFEDVRAFLAAFGQAREQNREDLPEQVVWFPSVPETAGQSGAASPIARVQAAAALLEELRLLSAGLPPSAPLSIAGRGLFAPGEAAQGEMPLEALALAPLTGFARSLRNEKAAPAGFRLIALGEAAPVREEDARDSGYPHAEEDALFEPAFDAGALGYLLAAEIAEAPGPECEVFLDAAGRTAPRLAPAEGPPPVRAAEFDPRDKAQAVVLGDPQAQEDQPSARVSSLNALKWRRETFKPPGPGQISVRTLAASLHFKDLLKIAGLVPDSVTRDTHNGGRMGMEAFVEITQCGPSVRGLRPGQRFLALCPGAFASRRILEAGQTPLIPVTAEMTARFSSPQIAASGVAAVTAWASLIRLARLERGENVLIHAGAGGVGQMAVQIALAAGARVFATASTEEKRRHLLDQGCEAAFNSRALDFVDGVKRATGGRGADVALSSLPMEGLAATLKAMAPGGRVVEIGKQAAAENLPLLMGVFNGNLSLHAFDLDRLALEDPDRVRKDFQALMKLYRQGRIVPPPVEVFPASRAAEAFRHFASSRHIGKIVLDFSDGGLAGIAPEVPLYPARPIRADGAYLVTGGMRGFGLETARWLAEKGAGEIHLLGRGPAPERLSDELGTFVAAAGEKVHLHYADVADAQAMARLIAEIGKSRPLKGIFHSAAATRDALARDLCEADLVAALAPKMGGALALWEGCRKAGVRLEHFVMHSSLAAMLGNVGQAAYGAACAFEDAFARKMAAMGAPARSIAWGPIAEGGLYKGNEKAMALFARTGLEPMLSAQALGRLEETERRGLAWAGCADSDWGAFFQAVPGLAEQARFVRMKAGESGRSALLALPPEQRESFIAGVMADELASVLKLEASALDLATPVLNLGLDSMAALELQMALEKRLGVTPPAALLATAEKETVGGLAKALAQHFSRMDAAPGPERAP